MNRSPTPTPMPLPPTNTSTPQPARDRKDRTARTSNTQPHPPPAPAVPAPHHPPATLPPPPPPRDQATDATRGSPHQPIGVSAPADTQHRESPLPRPPEETPSPDPTRDNDDHPPQPTPSPPSHPAPPAAAPAEPYALHNPAAVRQHLRGLGDQEVLRLHTSGTTQRIQAATLEEGFLHVARHDRPTVAEPDGESPPPTGDQIWVPPVDLGRHLVGHPVPERTDTGGHTRYRESDMAHPPPSATPSNTKGWERETWVARVASLSNFRHHVLGGVPTPDDQQPAPSTYMTLMYNLHYTLSGTHYHTPTGHWVVHGTDSLLPADYAPPPTQPRPRHVHQGG